MTIHREGYKTIAIVTVIFLLLNLVAVRFFGAEYSVLVIAFAVLSLAFVLFIVSFFRVPHRTYTIDGNKIIAPADGKVVVIEESHDEEYFKDKRLQVSIFMSPANVHVNRNPVDGDVVYSKYHKGKYLVAWNPKSSTENERHSHVVNSNGREILIKQIAGALAKRIVNYLQPGAAVKQGEEFGFIKFGSRVDLLLPLGTRVNVNLNETVKGGITVIATL